MKNHNLALLAIVAASLIAGGNPTFTKIGLKEFPPLGFIFIRFVLSLVFLSPYLFRRIKKIGKEMLPVFFLSLLSTANIILFTFGVKRTTATVSQMIYAVVPIITAILSAMLLKEKLPVQKIGGIILGLVGMILIVVLPVLNRSATAGDFMGNLMIVVGAISFSIYTVLSKQFQEKYSPIFLTVMFLLTTAGSTSVLALPELINQPGLISDISASAWLSLAYVAILGTAIYYFLFQYAIKTGSPVIASMSLYLSPVSAFVWAFFLLGERLTPTFVVGAILALSGAWLTTRSK